MALGLAIVVLMVVEMIVAGAYFVAIQEARVGESARRLQQSFGVAEEGVFDVLRSWDPATYNARPAYPLDSLPVPRAVSQHQTGTYGGYVYRLNGELYLIDITARAPAGGAARQRIGLLAHVRPLHMGIEAPVTSGKGARLWGQVAIDGNDGFPPGWLPCGSPDSTRAGIRTGRGPVSQAGPARVVGSPPVEIAPGSVDSAFSGFGDVDYAQLAGRANSVLPGGLFGSGIGPAVVNGRCDETVATNWGDGTNPDRPCGDYFPIVHITGDATLSGVQGQGTLLVDGSLAVRGGLEWYGIVLVRGTVLFAPDGGGSTAIWGAIIARDSIVAVMGPGARPGRGSVTINYSKCPIVKALEPIAPALMLRTRGWVGLF